MAELNVNPGERAGLVGEEVRHQAQLLVDVRRVAPAGHRQCMLIYLVTSYLSWSHDRLPGRHVPLFVVQLQVPAEELAGRELLQLEGDVHRDGNEVAVYTRWSK